MSVVTANVREGAARRPFVDRLLAATPLLALVACLAFVYAVEAVGHTTPIVFSDELEWTQLSRAVAEDGVASIRGERRHFESLYVYLVAPVWWLGDTAASYETLKYLNILLMTSAAFPAYLLARRLVSKGAAVAVATASIAIPPMVYALHVLTEPLAYPWAVLCAWLVVEALALRTRGWVAAAVAVSLVAPLVRGQLIVIPLAFAAAALAVWWRSDHARRLRRPGWVRGDTVALVLLAVGAFAVLSRLLLHSSSQWRLATDTSSHVLSHALWAVGALAIGIGVLPLVAGLTALVPRPRERLRPHDGPFIALTVAFVGLFGFYTGIKGAYNEVTFANRIDERNVFYVAPLLFLGTAIALERRRLRLLPALAAAGLAAYLFLTTPIQLSYPYFDAPGFSIAAMANRELWWTPAWIEWALIVTLVVSLGALAAARVLRGPAARALLAVVALVVVAWNVTGQVTAAGGANQTARAYLGNLPQPPDWVDEAAGGAEVTYLGQTITSGGGLRTNLTEFWNPSIVNVWTLDGSLLFPGPTFTPRLAEANGTLTSSPGTSYVLADSGINPVGEPVASRGDLRLFPLDGPIRLRDSVEAVDEEGWMGRAAAYNRFAEAQAGGELVVSVSRTAFCPDASIAPPAPRVSVAVGRLHVILRDAVVPHPGMAERWTTRSRVVPNCEQRELRIPVGPPPWRAEVTVDRTFRPADYGAPDTRTLGVMVGFRYEPPARAQ